MKSIKIIAATLLIAGCTATAQVRSVQLSVQQIETVRTLVKSHLKDPYSAHIEGVRGGYKPNGTLVACGYVNAKNSFGAYAGRNTFVVQGGDVQIGEEGTIPHTLCNIFFGERMSPTVLR